MTRLSPLTLCAIEGAASGNSAHNIYVLLPHNVIATPQDIVPSFFSKFVEYFVKIFAPMMFFLPFRFKNLHVVRADFGLILSGLPMFKLWREGKIQAGKYALQNISNIVRLALLYRYRHYELLLLYYSNILFCLFY